VEVKKSPKLPDGVGKRIIEALRKQNESKENEQQLQRNSRKSKIKYADTALQNDSEDSNWYSEDKEEDSFDNYISDYDNEDDSDTVSENEDDEEYSSDESEEYNYAEDEDDYAEDSDEEESEIEYDEHPSRQERTYRQPQTKERRYEQPEKRMKRQQHADTGSRKEERSYDSFPYEAPVQKIKQNKQARIESKNSSTRSRDSKALFVKPQITEFNPESNSSIDVLMRLIAQLPPGVTRQTGAQIIRQTMEAMGTSMNKVLAEAQQIQEENSNSIKNDINTIEEYRNNIKILEKKVQRDRKKVDELEDLISLFILSEKDSKR